MTNEDWTKNFQKLTELSNLATEKQIEFYRSILVAGGMIFQFKELLLLYKDYPFLQTTFHHDSKPKHE